MVMPLLVDGNDQHLHRDKYHPEGQHLDIHILLLPLLLLQLLLLLPLLLLQLLLQLVEVASHPVHHRHEMLSNGDLEAVNPIIERESSTHGVFEFLLQQANRLLLLLLLPLLLLQLLLQLVEVVSHPVHRRLEMLSNGGLEAVKHLIE